MENIRRQFAVKVPRKIPLTQHPFLATALVRLLYYNCTFFCKFSYLAKFHCIYYTYIFLEKFSVRTSLMMTRRTPQSPSHNQTPHLTRRAQSARLLARLVTRVSLRFRLWLQLNVQKQIHLLRKQFCRIVIWEWWLAVQFWLAETAMNRLMVVAAQRFLT